MKCPECDGKCKWTGHYYPVRDHKPIKGKHVVYWRCLLCDTKFVEQRRMAKSSYTTGTPPIP